MRLPKLNAPYAMNVAARNAYIAVVVLLAMAVGYGWLYTVALNADIRQANAKADMERQCAHALEAWVHRQVVPGEPPQTEALNAVKDKACRTQLVL